MRNLEIERKYLIRKSDIDFDYKKYRYHKIAQSFIYLKPTIRIRKCDYKYYLTVKNKLKNKSLSHIDDLVRDEYEIEISRKAYNDLTKRICGRIIHKVRYYIPYRYKKKNYTIELDVFEKELKGLIYAEVEFGSEKEAVAFKAPDWFYKDVTGIDKYKNTSLSICKNVKNLLKY